MFNENIFITYALSRDWISANHMSGLHGSDTRYPIFTRSQHSLFFSLPFKGGIHLIKEDLEISLLKEYLP